MNYEFVSDKKGKRKAVIVPVRDFERMLNDSEELSAIRDYKKAKKGKLSFRSLDSALEDIKIKRERKN